MIDTSGDKNDVVKSGQIGGVTQRSDEILDILTGFLVIQFFSR